MLFVFIFQVLAENYSLLINTSKGFINYRHMSNINILYDIFKNIGMPEENIFALYQEDPHFNSRNPIRDKIFLTQENFINKSAIKNKIGCEDLTEMVVLNILKLGTSELKHLDERDNLIIYMCGHGRDGFLKVCDRYFIFKHDLIYTIKILAKRLNKVLLILDTCQASSLIDDKDIPSNVTIVTTSLYNEFSYSSHSVPNLGIFGVDDFALSYYQSDLNYDLSLSDFFAEIGKKLFSTIKVWGNSALKMRIFVEEDKNKEKIKKFIL